MYADLTIDTSLNVPVVQVLYSLGQLILRKAANTYPFG